MTEQENKHKKVPVTTYHLGEKGHLMVAEMSTGYHCWGKVGEKHLEAQGNDLKSIYQEISNQIHNAHVDYTLKAMNCEEVCLRIQEAIKSDGNPLEKLAKDLGGEIIERK